MRGWAMWLGLALISCGGEDDPRVTARADAFVVVGGGGARLRLSASAEQEVTLQARGGGNLSFEPAKVTISAGGEVDVTMIGQTASAAENDTEVEVVVGGMVVATTPVTVVSGLELAFEGTFGFAVNNNNGAFAAGMSCGAVNDPAIWRSTPLPCEGLDATFGKLYLDEVVGKPDRWPLDGGKRPAVEVVVTAIRTVDPAIDLAGRDPLLDVGTAITAEQDAAALMFTDNCDEAATGEPDGSHPGVEPIGQLSVKVGEAFVLGYEDPAYSARIWTTFPAPASVAEVAASAAEVDEVFFVDGATGCSDVVTFFDDDGALHCDEPHSVKAMFARNAAYRATVKGAWANFTSRSMATTARNEASPLARIFDAREIFMQLAGYDWFTLTGRIDKGVITTAGGIPPRFVEWRTSDGCPSPAQPDVSEDDRP